MSFDKNKATELMINANKYIPKLIIFMVICWFATPVLMGIGAMTKLAFFSILGAVVSFLSTILFYGLIICLIINVINAQNKQNASTRENKTQEPQYSQEIEEYSPQVQQYTSETPDYMPQEQEYISQVQEYDYNNASYNTSEMNYAMSEKQAQKQYEKEIFAAQHPILSILKEKIIPFVWFLAILCAIITGVICFLNYIYGIKLNF